MCVCVHTRDIYVIEWVEVTCLSLLFAPTECLLIIPGGYAKQRGRFWRRAVQNPRRMHICYIKVTK